MTYHETPEQTAALDAYADDMREQVAFELAHPRFDPQQLPDGRYGDPEAERLGDLAERQYARNNEALDVHACDESEMLADLSEHPIWDRRLQPDPGHQLVPDAVLALLHNTVAAKSAEAMVSAALKSWMDGDPLTQREQRIVDVVCDANYATQIGRLCLPAH